MTGTHTPETEIISSNSQYNHRFKKNKGTGTPITIVIKILTISYNGLLWAWASPLKSHVEFGWARMGYYKPIPIHVEFMWEGMGHSGPPWASQRGSHVNHVNRSNKSNSTACKSQVSEHSVAGVLYNITKSDPDYSFGIKSRYNLCQQQQKIIIIPTYSPFAKWS